MSFESVMPPYNSTDPNASFLSSSCLDFLLIELVPLTYRVTRELDDASAASLRDAAVLDPTSAPADASSSASQQPRAPPSSAAGAGSAAPSASRKMDEDEERDAVFYRLERLGYRVGQGLVER